MLVFLKRPRLWESCVIPHNAPVITWEVFARVFHRFYFSRFSPVLFLFDKKFLSFCGYWEVKIAHFGCVILYIITMLAIRWDTLCGRGTQTAIVVNEITMVTLLSTPWLVQWRFLGVRAHRECLLLNYSLNKAWSSWELHNHHTIYTCTYISP